MNVIVWEVCVNKDSSQSNGFSRSHVSMWELDIKKAERWRIDAFKLGCWRRLLRIPWTARRSNQSIRKEINPEYSLEGLCWSWSSNTLATWWEEPTHWKRPWCWERLKTEGEEGDRGEMDEWYHWCNGHELGQTLGDGEGQRSLACCRPCSHKEFDTTKQLNNNIGEEAAFKVCFSLTYCPIRPPVSSQFPEPFHLTSLHCILSSLACSFH